MILAIGDAMEDGLIVPLHIWQSKEVHFLKVTTNILVEMTTADIQALLILHEWPRLSLKEIKVTGM